MLLQVYSDISNSDISNSDISNSDLCNVLHYLRSTIVPVIALDAATVQ